MKTKEEKTLNSSTSLFIPVPVPLPLLKSARSLRGTMTDAEQLLWYCLRRKQLGGFRFRRQHPVERFVLDFYCYETRLGIELDGGQHNEPSAQHRDRERTGFLSCRGIEVLRFWNNDVFTNLEGVLQRIYEVLMERTGKQALAEQPPSQPPPLGPVGPLGGGVSILFTSRATRNTLK